LIFLYNLFISLYVLAIRMAALWKKKAAEWIDGRKDLLQNLQKEVSGTDNLIWMHCSSAGEFEQGKPLLESLKERYPHYKLLVTFFSPSGYNAAKKYTTADYKTYLPLDTKKNAEQFLKIIHPELVIFVKYDYWFHHLAAVHSKGIPLLMVSSIFRENGVFFKWYGSFYRKMLQLFTHIFVQNESSKNLLNGIGINHCSVVGDTRFDRVSMIAEKAAPIDFINDFIGTNKVLIAGSTWPDDEKMLHDTFKELKGVKLIVAPHEINSPHIQGLLTLFRGSIPYSKASKKSDLYSQPVLIIDNVGMLSRLYQYATITYIGGGFNKSGIHNTLEAAVWEKPVLFGPNYKKFKEAKDLINEEGGFSVSDKEELKKIMERLLADDAFLGNVSDKAKKYVQRNRGATQKIIAYIQENRLLTRL
jgi:3-deoxy-D-manno-octulosonic-acid transferase